MRSWYADNREETEGFGIKGTVTAVPKKITAT